MSHRSVGTLITHNNPTYEPPALMPGYRGYVPTIKFSYGDTFGNATMKHFQDFRCAAISTSTSPYSVGGMFPSIHSSNPRLAPSSRSHCLDRGLYSPYWVKYNVDLERQAELKRFDELTQKHRAQYKDTTGTLQLVHYFVMAENNACSLERERERGRNIRSTHNMAHRN